MLSHSLQPPPRLVHRTKLIHYVINTSIANVPIMVRINDMSWHCLLGYLFQEPELLKLAFLFPVVTESCQLYFNLYMY